MAKGLLVIRMSRLYAAKSVAYWVMKNVRPHQQASPTGTKFLMWQARVFSPPRFEECWSEAELLKAQLGAAIATCSLLYS